MKRDFVISQELSMKQQSLPSGGWVLLPQGALDSNTSEEFRNRVQQFLDEKEPPRSLLLDLSGVKYLSSVGLGALIQLLKKSELTRSLFALYDPQLAVRRVLEISKLDFLLVDPLEIGELGPFSEYVTRKETERAAARAAAPKR